MNGSPELLEFYLVEASEYVDALERLLVGAHAAPDLNALLASARALRGSSTMAKVRPIAELSQGLELIAGALRDGELRWTEDLFGALRTTADDLRLLVRDVRVWGDREQGRAEACRQRLAPFLPDRSARPSTPAGGTTTPMFLALQCAAIAGELDAFVDNPSSRRSLDDALARLRTIRGIAGIADHAPLGDVADAVDRVGRRLMPDAVLSPDEHELFRAAATLLRRAAEQLRVTGRHEAEQSDLARFARAVSALDAPSQAEAPVVRIDQLFYVDEGPHVLRRSPNPPTTPDRRLGQELVARADHLRRLAAESRSARDLVARDRSVRLLRAALAELPGVADSFGATALAERFRELANSPGLAEGPALSRVESAAGLLAPGFSTIAELEARFLASRQVERAEAPVGASASPSAAWPPLPAGQGSTRTPSRPHRDVPSSINRAQDRAPSAAPTGRELKRLLSVGLEGFRTLEAEVLGPADPATDDDIVPIESLLYQGRAALDRAIELRDAIRQSGTADQASLDEIFDLLDLARTG